MELGPLFEYLWSVNNLIIMVGCGAAMELFKRGPLTSKFAKTKWGKIGAYYAPYLWCLLFLLIPWGLSPAEAGVGERIVLGLILGGATSKVYDTVLGTFKHALSKGEDPQLLKSK